MTPPLTATQEFDQLIKKVQDGALTQLDEREASDSAVALKEKEAENVELKRQNDQLQSTIKQLQDDLNAADQLAEANAQLMKNEAENMQKVTILFAHYPS